MSSRTPDGRRRDFLGLEKVCPTCGKVFLLPPLNVYKFADGKGNTMHYCSYSCFRVEQRKREDKRPLDMTYEPLRRKRSVKSSVN